jgi:3D-(3,5/4)-trihydroxycyclohexane-1,2-dione acylhydrolase (decyclizing)
MGHEVPAALGIRLARPEAGEIFVVLGDGGYLMSPSELVTAAQEGLKITVVLVVNGGYQSIHSLQRASLGRSFGNEFRGRASEGALDGPLIAVDYAAGARSFGCEVFEVASPTELGAALDVARGSPGPAVVVATVEPQRGLPGGGAFWDLGVPEVAADAAVTERAGELRVRRSREQRFYG